VKEVASVIELSDGKQISASQFLEHFMFSGKLQYTPVSKLSGGEKRRLALMMVLIKNPNFLILDEPTNDLDLMTLQKLEEFLLNFGGCLIVVSHDRFFMDKLVEHYFVFEGNGVIHDHNGTYLEYRAIKEEQEAEQRRIDREKRSPAKPAPSRPVEKKNNKLSYKEQKKLKKLEKEIADLEERKTEIESIMNGSELDHNELQKISQEYAELNEKIDEETLHWLELAEKDQTS